MPETKRKALARAKRGGFKKSSVVKSNGYFIAPKGIKTTTAKKTYAKLRSKGSSKERAAKIAWTVEKGTRRK